MKKIDKYMMATKAIHQLGDISSDTPDICRVHEEHDEHYVGEWVTGLGFINVKFPKETTRNLTEDEIEKYSKYWYQLSSQPTYKLDIKSKCE